MWFKYIMHRKSGHSKLGCDLSSAVPNRAHKGHVIWLYYIPKNAEKSGLSKSSFGLSAAVPNRAQLTVGIFSFSCLVWEKMLQNRKCYIPKNSEKSGDSESDLHFLTPANSQAQFAKNCSINSFSLHSGFPWIGKNKWYIMAPSRSIKKHFQQVPSLMN